MKRLGVILPSSNTTVEKEFSQAIQNSEVSVHYSRVHLAEVTVKGLEDMEAGLAEAADLLFDAAVDLVLFACTSGSLIKGYGYDLALSKKISDAAGCPAFATSTAVVKALHALGVERISLATPYVAEVAQREVVFLEQSGFQVVREASLGLVDNLEIGRLVSEDAAGLAAKVDSAQSQAVFVSCTNLQTFGKLKALEIQLGKPVVSSNSASLWLTLKTLKAQPLTCLPLARDLFSSSAQ